MAVMVEVGYRNEDGEVPIYSISNTDDILELFLSIHSSYWK